MNMVVAGIQVSATFEVIGAVQLNIFGKLRQAQVWSHALLLVNGAEVTGTVGTTCLTLATRVECMQEVHLLFSSEWSESYRSKALSCRRACFSKRSAGGGQF